jgi:hypothetical protein
MLYFILFLKNELHVARAIFVISAKWRITGHLNEGEISPTGAALLQDPIPVGGALPLASPVAGSLPRMVQEKEAIWQKLQM